MTKQQDEKCRACGGSGFERRIGRDEDPDICGRCGGDGREL